LTQSSRELALAYEAADVLLPNSQGEADSIRAELGVSTPIRVVPNGADPAVFGISAMAGRVGVVMASRMEPLKNQLALIKACRALDADLTLVGRVHPHHESYAVACRQTAGPSVTFVDHLAPSDLASVFQRSAVHALPSWFETTGLSSLEAALAGCAIVTTDRGYAGEYFGSDAEYCDPASRTSIRSALERALRRGPPPSLSEHIAASFNWDVVAERTLAAYED